jgi:hypothetical protein
VLNNVIVKMVSAGVDGDQLPAWLESCGDGDDSVLPDLNEADLITGELVWHIGHVHRTAENYCQRCGDATLEQEVRRFVAPLADHVTRLQESPQG